MKSIVIYIVHTVISKYLYHSKAVSAKHYDFMAVESSSTQRQTIVNLIREHKSVDIETESHSNVKPDIQNMELTDQREWVVLAGLDNVD